jgi:hypothetical protein
VYKHISGLFCIILSKIMTFLNSFLPLLEFGLRAFFSTTEPCSVTFCFAVQIGSGTFACLTLDFDAPTSYFPVVEITVVHHNDWSEYEKYFMQHFFLFVYSYVYAWFESLFPTNIQPLPHPLCFNKGV